MSDMKKGKRKMGKKQLDTLCRYYAEGIALCVHNIGVLEEHIVRKRTEGKDPAQEEKAVRRLMASKEGLQRMLSDRMRSLGAGKVDVDRTLEHLELLKREMQGNEHALDELETLIITMREKLTNVDRGRRELQKKMGQYKKEAKAWRMRALVAEERVMELSDVTGKMAAERTGMIMDHAEHHCLLEYNCKGCPFEKYCHAEDADEQTCEQRMADREASLKAYKDKKQ